MVNPLDIRCTWCNAKPGQPCVRKVSASVRVALEVPHPERRGEAKWLNDKANPVRA